MTTRHTFKELERKLQHVHEDIVKLEATLDQTKPADTLYQQAKNLWEINIQLQYDLQEQIRLYVQDTINLEVTQIHGMVQQQFGDKLVLAEKNFRESNFTPPQFRPFTWRNFVLAAVDSELVPYTRQGVVDMIGFYMGWLE